MCDFNPKAGTLQVKMGGVGAIPEQSQRRHHNDQICLPSPLCTKASRGLARARISSPTVHVQPCTQPEAATAAAAADISPPSVVTAPVQANSGSSALKQSHFQLNDCWSG